VQHDISRPRRVGRSGGREGRELRKRRRVNERSGLKEMIRSNKREMIGADS
jgi:hypothetical protein